MAVLREFSMFPSKFLFGARLLICPINAFHHGSPKHINSAISNVGVGTNPEQTDSKKVSKAMKAYMERAQIHDNFIKQQLHEYNIGKRHLANMMGQDPELFTQADVDEAIKYLFPSGLFDPRARPMMKHPDDIYPKRKAAEFDVNGRPHHNFFYTSKPNYYKLLHDIAKKFKSLDKLEDTITARGNYDQKRNETFLFGSDWISKTKLENELLESLTDAQYSTLVKTLERFGQHPYAYRQKDFIMKFRHQLAAQTEIQKVPELLYDETKRPFMTFSSRRKRSSATVKVIGQGVGSITINGKDIHYFEKKQDKEQIIFPLQFSDMLGKVDVVASVEGVGSSAQAGAIRYGISMCLRSFLDAETIENMRLAGLLSFDPRSRERKKPGQAGARKKFTWKKR